MGLTFTEIHMKEAYKKSGALLTSYLRDPLHRNALFLVINTGLSGIVGLTFWVFAARLQSPQELGLASALISTCTQLALLASLGLDLGLVRFLPEYKDKPHGLINSVLTLAGLSGIMVGIIFLIGIPLWSPALKIVITQPAYFIGFTGLTLGLVLFSMTNSSFVGLRKSRNVLFSSTTAGVCRIAFLFILGLFSGSLSILFAWGLSIWIAITLSTVILLPREIKNYFPSPRFDWASLKPLASQSSMNYIAHLLFNSQLHFVPLILISLIGPESNAFYFSALALASPTWVIPLAVSMVVVVEGAHNVGNLPLIIRNGLRIAALIDIPLLIFLWFGGPYLLLAFGERYSEESIQTLRVLAVTSIPVVLIDFYLAIGRIQKKMLGPVGLLSLVATGSLVGTYLLVPHLGILGAAFALLISNSFGGLIALGKMAKLKKTLHNPE
jgi:O-antigen/teichoic acid export membrane protein